MQGTLEQEYVLKHISSDVSPEVVDSPRFQQNQQLLLHKTVLQYSE